MEDNVKFKAEGSEKPEKMPYEQLENIARQLSIQNEQMREQLQCTQMGYMWSVLDMLMRITEHKDCYPEKLVSYCTSEIEKKVNQLTKGDNNNGNGATEDTGKSE